MDERSARGPAFTAATRHLHAAALARAVDEPDAADRIVPLLTGALALRPHLVDRAIDAAVRAAAHDLLSRGWRPAEIDRFAAKRLDPPALDYLHDALAGTAPGAPPWLPELRAVAPTRWWSSRRPHVTQWAERHGAGRAVTLRVVVDVLALLAGLPRTDDPLPGMPDRPAVAGDVLVPDERLAGRVDALLARAADTEYPDEAAACAVKAEQLMRRPVSASPPAPFPVEVVRSVLAQVGRVRDRLLGRRPVAALPPSVEPEPELVQVPNGRSW